MPRHAQLNQFTVHINAKGQQGGPGSTGTIRAQKTGYEGTVQVYNPTLNIEIPVKTGG
jgi:hypothetical protein